jgi:hypothetical protein
MSTIEIPLSKGKFAIIDREDLEFVMRYKWHCRISGKYKSTYYAHSGSGGVLGIKMHTYILNCPAGMIVDHINGNGLDNRRSNIRICTYQENAYNRKKPTRGKSRFKGVHLTKDGKWQVEIKQNKKTIYVGRFSTEIEAARAYNAKALELHGEFANLNRGIIPSDFKLVFKWQ